MQIIDTITPFEMMEMLGKPVLFTNARIKKEDVPEGLIRYELRHDDEGNLCSIVPSLLCDHYGTVLSKEPLLFENENGKIEEKDLGLDDYNFFGPDMTVQEYWDNYAELKKMCATKDEVKPKRVIKVTIEEHISKTFEVEVVCQDDDLDMEAAMQIAKEKYHQGEFLVESSTPTVRFMADDGEHQSEWVEF